jgi:radical SAM superfamily enzyme YgiQ (UPF0313 family)
MNIAVCYPPFQQGREYPLLTQNRQFKYTNSREIRIYPIVMASLATMLKNDGHEVLWLDGINERLDMREFGKRLKDFAPDFCILETKAPLVKRHWEYLRRLKEEYPGLRTILTGDHVSFFPEESMKNSPVDYLIMHGDYDFVCRDILRALAADRKGRRAVLPGGVWSRGAKGEIRRPSRPGVFYDVNECPEPDRILTRWHLYGEAYLHHPVAYILSGRGCGGPNNRGDKGRDQSSFPGRCSFCIWQYAFWKAGARMRKPSLVADEILHLVERFKVREVFDDNESGACWNKRWLEEFYRELQSRKLLGRVRISSNARADSLRDNGICDLLKKCGYRLLKVGVESGNNRTLEILKKDETIETIREGIKNAKRHGLIVMMTTMVGYPWEDEAGAKSTFEATKELMLYKTHFGDSLQASVIVPYPGTPLFKEAQKNHWFVPGFDPSDYEKYDMAHQILTTKIDSEYWCKKMWRIHLHPLYLLKSFFSLRQIGDIKLALRGLVSLLGHLGDYKNK